MGSAHKINSPKSLIFAHQTRNSLDDPNKKNNSAIFDNLDLRKHYVETDGQQYPRDSSLFL